MPDEQSMQMMQPMQPAEPMRSMDPMQAMNGHEAVGHLYTQTNELRNAIIHYRRSKNGAIEERSKVRSALEAYFAEEEPRV